VQPLRTYSRPSSSSFSFRDFPGEQPIQGIVTDIRQIPEGVAHIIDDLVANFIASLPAEEVYHAAQQRGFTWGAVRAPEALLNDPHLNDRGFWKEVAHPELGRSFVYPGEAAIYNGSPWRISRRAPLIGEHNVEIFCTELGLSRNELSVLAENRVI
jgi:crotonobetainyl-CoA:carnitine CoA-transferase CaiB-like acyl-CoA transferase